MSEIFKVSTVNATVAAEKKEDTDMLLGSNASVAAQIKEDKIMKSERIDVTINEAVAKIKSGEYNTCLGYQRSDEQWTKDQQSCFIDSVMRGIDIPKIIIAENEGTSFVVDGKQRLTTLKKFLKNGMRLSNKVECASEDGKYNDNAFDELPEEMQSKIKNTELEVVYYKDCSIDDIKMLFKRYNNGTPLSKSQVLRCDIGTDAIDWIDVCTKKPIFNKPIAKFTDKQIKEQVQLDCFCQSVYLIDCYFGFGGKERQPMISLSNDNMKKYSSEKISNFDEATREEINKTLDFVSNIKTQGILKTALPYLVLMGHIALKNEIDTEQFNNYANKFKGEVSDNKNYKKTCASGTISKTNVKKKMVFFINIFSESFPNIDLSEMKLVENPNKKSTKAKDKSVSSKEAKDGSDSTTENNAAQEVTSEKASNENASASAEADSSKSTPEVDVDVEKSATTEVTETTSEEVDTENSEDVEVSDTIEATETTSEVETPDISNNDGVSQSAEAPADASSDTSETPVEDSASDSSEADADPAKDVSDGTEVVA